MNKLTLLAAALGLTVVAQAATTVVWSDNFSTARASNLNPYDFAGGAVGDDYSIAVGAGNTLTVGSGIATSVDTSANATTAGVATTQFAPFTLSAGDQVTFSVDFRLNSYTAATNGVSVPKFSIFDGNSAVGAESFTVGYGTGSSGAPSGTTPNTFYYGLSAGTAGLGTITGPSGFSFGNYVAGANATGGFYRIAYTLTQGSTTVSGLITRLDGSMAPTSDVASFTTSALGAAFDWSAPNANDGIRIASGGSGLSNFDVDNMSVSVTTAIPEPSTYGLLGAGVLAAVTAVRRRRRAK